MSTSSSAKPPVCRPTHAGGADGSHAADLENRGPRASTLHHWTILVLACGVVTAAAMLSVRNRQQVVVPILNQPLPGTCTFFRFTGLPCPGCGLTRSFISMAHGQFAEAWRFNSAGLLFFAVVLGQIPYRAWQIHRIRCGRGEHRFAGVDTWVLVGLVFVLLLQWACALLTHLW
jgi:hypothetical protein